MVNGVNSNYYNYYNNYQNQYGSYGLQQPTFTSNPTIIGGVQQQQAPQATKTAEDGKDDGSISFFSKLKNLAKGAVKFVTGMFTDENGNFSLTQTFKSVAIAVGIGAVCALTGGTAIPAILAATGVAVSGLGVARAGIQAAMAETDAEAEQAWQSLGSNGVALGLSIAGAKAVAKSNALAAGESVEQFSGVKGSLNAVKQVFHDSAQPFKAAAAGVKDAYQGATLSEKVLSASSKLKDNVVAQGQSLKTTITNNYNSVVNPAGVAAEDITKTDAAKKVLAAAIERLKEGNLKDNIVHQNNPAQWLTAGIVGRQFGETPEYRFYSQLTPQEQAYYKALPYSQKLAIINRFEQAS